MEADKQALNPSKDMLAQLWQPRAILSIRQRIWIGMGAVLVLIVLFIGIIYTQGMLVRQQTLRYEQLFDRVPTNSAQIQLALSDIRYQLQGRIFVPPDEKPSVRVGVRNKLEEIWEEQVRQYFNTNDQCFAQHTLPAHLHTQHQQVAKLLNQLYLVLEKAKPLVAHPPSTAISNTDSSTAAIVRYYHAPLDSLYQSEFLPILQQWQIAQQKSLNQLDTQRNIEAQSMATSLWMLRFLAIICWVLIFAVLGAMGYFLSKQIRDEVQRYEIYTQQLIHGHIPDTLHTHSAEFATLTQQLNILQQNFAQLSHYAHDISQGRYNTQALQWGNQGTLGQALWEMHSSFAQTATQNEMRLWRNQGLAIFAELLRTYQDNLVNLAERLITRLVAYLEVEQGLFYLLETETFETKEKDGGSLRFVASYGFEQPVDFREFVRLGQGLVGQAWQEGQTLYTENIPASYLHNISSSLGNATPACLLVVPLRYNEQTYGAIELSSFKQIPAARVAFVEEIAEDIASTIAASKSYQQTRELLTASQQLTKNLRTKELETQQTLHELQETQERMAIAQRTLAEKEANLDALINNTSHAILAFDTRYNITVLNKAMKEIYAAEGIHLNPGKNLLRDLPSQDINRHRQEYERALAGEKFDVTRVSQQKGYPRFHKLSYNPIHDDSQRVIGASIFIENITQQMSAEIALKKTEASLQSLINDTEDLILSLDSQYQIIVANEAFINYYKHLGRTVKLNRNLLDIALDERERRFWKRNLQRALKGERFVKQISFKEQQRKQYWDYWFNPIHDENQQISGVSVFVRNVTSHKEAEVMLKYLLLESLENDPGFHNPHPDTPSSINDGSQG
ncbi:PAS domain-containing protein [Eisenibacter elegans]|uniref:PAS domain-containing protein n=1 Tax=Eisenibacter elegans TaxID=997 RepID=UPI0004289169|nr:PAS domain-containing protein [Eisenibacter elegans]